LPLTIEIQAVSLVRREHHGGLHGAVTLLLRTGDVPVVPEDCRRPSRCPCRWDLVAPRRSGPWPTPVTVTVDREPRPPRTPGCQLPLSLNLTLPLTVTVTVLVQRGALVRDRRR
jgi:hypothetical protein